MSESESETTRKLADILETVQSDTREDEWSRSADAVLQNLAKILQSWNMPRPTATERCRQCNTELAESAKFCHVCGTPVAMPTVPGKCGSCGHQNPVEARFCSECGHGLSEAMP